MVEQLLREQASLTAVEEFAQHFESVTEPLQRGDYIALLPATAPGEGQQFAFQVDLDACSGCKACVAACHNLNGLDSSELWRNVGLQVGIAGEQSLTQHITSSCHHCVEPACLTGCPTLAYEKDAETGIVRHLDEQCFGCQYCVLMCPYEVPHYSSERGIVRKCDMCHSRLAVGEAPACVQSCPNHAISIQLVERDEIVAEANYGVSVALVPGAPSSRLTFPTTKYKSRWSSRDTETVESPSRPQHAHTPLVLMLVLTQLCVGAFLVSSLIQLTSRLPAVSLAIALTTNIVALVLGMCGLTASLFHLGRPHLFFRAVLGWRKSWLSREAIVFGGFAGIAKLAIVANWMGASIGPWLTVAAVITGVAGVFCSIFVYTATRRPLWSPLRTTTLFLGTTLVLGLGTSLCVSIFTAAVGNAALSRMIAFALATTTIGKLAFESRWLAWQLNQQSPNHESPNHESPKPDSPKRAFAKAAEILVGELKLLQRLRWITGVIGGLLAVTIAIGVGNQAGPPEQLPQFFGFAATLAFAMTLAGELIERHMFFATSFTETMPGTPRHH